MQLARRDVVNEDHLTEQEKYEMNIIRSTTDLPLILIYY